MRHTILLAGAVFMLLFAASASAVTVDGYDNDWTNPDTVNDDPNEPETTADLDGYDIDYNFFIWNDDGTNNLYFGLREYALMTDPPYSGSAAAILIDADGDPTTGGDPYSTGELTGIDYYMDISLPDLPRGTVATPILYKWNGTGYTALWSGNPADPVPYQASVAREGIVLDTGQYEFIEWSLNASDIGWPGSFFWAGYIDNGQAPKEDHCPDDWRQAGYTPEPGSLVLLALGLPFGALWRRRRK